MFGTRASLEAQTELEYPRLPHALHYALEDIARWQGYSLAFEASDMATLAKGVSYDARDMFPVQWNRRSRRNPARQLRIWGFKGSLGLAGLGAELNQLLDLCETLSIGRARVLGLGQYEVLAGR